MAPTEYLPLDDDEPAEWEIQTSPEWGDFENDAEEEEFWRHHA
jgi:hypothetical protein